MSRSISELVPEFGHTGTFRDLETIVDLKKVPKVVKQPLKLFSRPTTMFMILFSDHEPLQLWLAAAHKTHHKLRTVDYDKLRQYRHFCSDSGCIGPCLRLAWKKGLISGTTWPQIKADYNLK